MAFTYRDLTKQQFIVLWTIADQLGADVTGHEDVKFLRELERRSEGMIKIGPPLRPSVFGGFGIPRIGVTVTSRGRTVLEDYKKNVVDKTEERKELLRETGERPKEGSPALQIIKGMK